MAASRNRRTTARSDVVERIITLARNLWWTWHPDPQRLFAALDPVQWEATNHNPLATLANLPEAPHDRLEEDAAFVDLLTDCEQQLAGYLKRRTWFQQSADARQRRLRVAYFCAEYGLHECLPQYAGGLGILAGDHLKSASDLGIPLVAVGLFYHEGHYRQELARDGTTRVAYVRQDPARLPMTDTGRVISVPLSRRMVHVRIWLVQVGRVPLYLLDADIPQNRPRDRALTARLYGGNQETRIAQEILLGMGGARALQTLGIKPIVYHLNEGHAAFCCLERLCECVEGGMSLARARERVRASTVFTTHTPVPAGHDRFDPKLMTRYLKPRLDAADIAPSDWLALGQERPGKKRESFCMTVLALRLAERSNGVAAIHGRVSREMWQHLFDVPTADDVPITHITNGIHTATWLAPEMRPVYDRYLAPSWEAPAPGRNPWQKAGRIPLDVLWKMRTLLRRRLVEFVRTRLRIQLQRRAGSPADLRTALDTLDENALTIGFARRFATYKRAPLIFADVKRLERILGDPRRPVQLIFAGKAHPADRNGQLFTRRIFQFTQRPGLRGRVVLLEDYDMHVARLLVSGCDVWLNNPVPPQEASGTSGMKPPLHGGLNCSVLDGWWPEAFDGCNGWAIETNARAKTPAARDRHDANAIYDLLENEIVPLFYRRDQAGIPHGWARRMVASMQTVCGQFNTHRMLAEYVALYSR